jgi:hypothetical protein
MNADSRTEGSELAPGAAAHDPCPSMQPPGVEWRTRTGAVALLQLGPRICARAWRSPRVPETRVRRCYPTPERHTATQVCTNPNCSSQRTAGRQQPSRYRRSAPLPAPRARCLAAGQPGRAPTAPSTWRCLTQSAARCQLPPARICVRPLRCKVARHRSGSACRGERAPQPCRPSPRLTPTAACLSARHRTGRLPARAPGTPTRLLAAARAAARCHGSWWPRLTRRWSPSGRRGWQRAALHIPAARAAPPP